MGRVVGGVSKRGQRSGDLFARKRKDVALDEEQLDHPGAILWRDL